MTIAAVWDSYDEALAERLMAKVEFLPDGCWEWTANVTHGGYGLIAVRGKGKIAHRVSYELLVGPIPVGLQLDHLCRNKGCINPAHLEPVTASENKRRDYAATLNGKCRRGLHDDVAENLIARGDGKRECRPCHLDRVHEHRERQRAAKRAVAA